MQLPVADQSGYDSDNVTTGWVGTASHSLINLIFN